MDWAQLQRLLVVLIWHYAVLVPASVVTLGVSNDPQQNGNDIVEHQMLGDNYQRLVDDDDIQLYGDEGDRQQTDSTGDNYTWENDANNIETDTLSVENRGSEHVGKFWKGKRDWADVRQSSFRNRLLNDNSGSQNELQDSKISGNAFGINPIEKRGWEDVRLLWNGYGSTGSKSVGKRGWEDVRSNFRRAGKRGWEDIRKIWQGFKLSGNSKIDKRGWEDVPSKWKGYSYLNNKGIGKRGWEDVKSRWRSYRYSNNKGIGKRGWEDVRKLWRMYGDSNKGKRGWEDVGVWNRYGSGRGKRGWEDVGVWNRYGSGRGKRGWEDVGVWNRYGSGRGKREWENASSFWRQFGTDTNSIVEKRNFENQVSDINQIEEHKPKRAWEVVDRIWNLPMVRKYLRSGKRSKEELVDVPVQPSGQQGTWMIDEVGYNMKDGLPVKDWDTFYFRDPGTSEPNKIFSPVPACDCCKQNPASECCITCAISS